MRQAILYYPSIDIKDSIWLRNALLYWDEVCSIVPYEDYEDFSPEIQYMQSRGLYRPVYPKDIFNGEHFEEFKNTVKRKLSYRGRLSENRFHSNRGYEVNESTDAEAYSLIHRAKIPYELKQIFDEAEDSSSEWIGIEERIASVYMRTLAEFAAKYDSQDTVIGTDSCIKMNSIYKYDARRINKNAATELIFYKALPLPSMYTSFEEIIDFKEKRRFELLELKIKIKNLENMLSECEDLTEVKSKISEFKILWAAELVKAEKMFLSDRVGFMLGSIQSFIATAGTASGLIQKAEEITGGNLVTQPMFGALAGASGLIAVGAKYMNYKNKINKNRHNGFAYILDAYKSGLIEKKINEYI